MRFLIDAVLPPETSGWLTQHGHDSVHVETVGLLHAMDEEILDFAVREDRTVVTMDMDFPEIVALRHLVVPGVILIRLSYAIPDRVHERLAVLLKTAMPEELRHTITVIEDDRFRIRKLPIA